MKIVIYDNSQCVIYIWENCSNIEIDQEKLIVSFHSDGSGAGLNGVRNFIIVEDDVEFSVGQILTEEHLKLDKKSQFYKVDFQKEFEKLKQHQVNQDLAIVDMFEQLMLTINSTKE